jgi:ribose 5-phosphate isomerase A
MKLGLGTGSTAKHFVDLLGEKVAAGLRVICVPTSEATRVQAEACKIPLTTLEAIDHLDVTIDGADEIDPAFCLIKGGGGALLREKVVASLARRVVIVAAENKLVQKLGSTFALPVEVVPFALPSVARAIAKLGCAPKERLREGRSYRTDNGNAILDCHVGPITDPSALDRAIREIPGVVGTGLFVGMASLVLIQDGESVRELRRPESP